MLPKISINLYEPTLSASLHKNLDAVKDTINKKAYDNKPAVSTGGISSGFGKTSPITDDKIKNGAVILRIKDENLRLKSPSMYLSLLQQKPMITIKNKAPIWVRVSKKLIFLDPSSQNKHNAHMICLFCDRW